MLRFVVEEYDDDNILYHEFYEINDNNEMSAQINAFENKSINILIFRDKIDKPCMEYIEEFMQMVKMDALDIIKDVRDYYIIDSTDFDEEFSFGINSIQYVIQCI